MRPPLVSIILLLYKPGFYLRPCLESIWGQSFRDFELLVIDNDSKDGTTQRAEEILKSEASQINWRLIANEKNSGFAAGHNQGIGEALGKFIFLLNQDVILDKDFLKNILEVFKENPKIGAAQGKLLRLKVAGQDLQRSDVIDNVGLEILKNRRIVARGQGQPDQGQFERTEEIFGADGAAPIFRRTALEDIKICVNPPKSSAFVPRSEYLDEDFFMYKEDVDLAWRLRLAGWEALYEPRAVAWHARTAGDSAVQGYAGIIRERLKINRFAKYFSFKNQRLMQIKDEQPKLLLKHFFWWFPKEVTSWIYILLFERYTLKAVKELFRQAPVAWQKRKIIMARKRVVTKEMEEWFK